MDPFEVINFFYPEDDQLRRTLLRHSLQVKDKALQILSDSPLKDSVDKETAVSGAILHDIGICRCNAPGIFCFGGLDYMAHGIAGAEMLRRWGRENGYDMEVFARICERHTGSGLTAEDIIKGRMPLPHKDFLPETAEEKLICLADKFFSKSGNMEERSFERVKKSMAEFGTASAERFDALCRFFDFCG